MSTTPTRYLNEMSPLSDMTLDQFLLVHGKEPTKKVVPPRPYGSPRQGATAEEQLAVRSMPNPDNEPWMPDVAPPEIQRIASQRAQEIMAKKKKHGKSAGVSSRAVAAKGSPAGDMGVGGRGDGGGYHHAAAGRTADAGVGVPTVSPGETSSPAVAYVLAAPTEGLEDEPLTTKPCGHMIEVMVQVQGVGVIALPLSCEVLGDHPNQPHHVQERAPLCRPVAQSQPKQVLFIGWADA